jgi:hypothetical protein
MTNWWPQDGGPIVPSGKTYDGKAYIQGVNGHSFNIAVLVVNELLNSIFTNWVKDCQKSQQWPAITKEGSTYYIPTRVILEKRIEMMYVFSWPVLRLAFVDCPALSVPKLPVSS